MVTGGGVPYALCMLVACGVCGCGAGPSGEDLLDVYVPSPTEAGADSTTVLAEGGGSTQIDRAGHPLVAVMLVPAQLDDSFNGQASFAANVPRTIEDAIEARLIELDTLALGDGGPDQVDWPIPPGGTHALLPAFAADTLLVDTGLSCADGDAGYKASYFDIDREVYLSGAAHSTCGGRTPGEDVVSETLTLLVSGPMGLRAPVSQGVPGPTKPAPMGFPYLAPPN
jgi:hypothetical protein